MTAARKPKKRTGATRNPFACEGWGRFIMRAIAMDARRAEAAARRQNADGDTLH
jgi:hypothetical protein